jgi:hypothetical protein
VPEIGVGMWNLSLCHSVHNNSHLDSPGIEPRLCSMNLLTNCMNYDMTTIYTEVKCFLHGEEFFSTELCSMLGTEVKYHMVQIPCFLGWY